MDLSAHEVEIPIPMSTNAYINDQGQSHSMMNEAIEDHHQNHITTIINKKGAILVRYRECLKNHAASIGGNATDGCGEFMPSGEDGTLEALKCSACNCHRNFHRKEIEGEPPNSSFSCRKLINGAQKGLLMNSNLMVQRPMPQNMIMPLQTSESDEMLYPRPPFVKKRFRTKFSAEQKEKMLAFAERVGWKLQKQEETVVQQLCQEIGVKRRVLKVWMHNNKHNLAKKAPMQSSSLSDRMNE